ncbi:MAG: YkgJ family cysteine cluster protein [Pseudomonadota bacterium]
MSDNTHEPQLVPDRSCDGCTMCCKVLEIDAPELQKPKQLWCTNCSIGTGCQIYEERPDPCRSFYCQYRKDPGLSEEWAPKKSKIIIDYEAENERLAIHVDDGRKSAWRAEPFYTRIKTWAQTLSSQGQHVLVWEGSEAIVLLRDREIRLGKIGAGRDLLIEKRATPTGPVVVDVRIAEGS